MKNDDLEVAENRNMVELPGTAPGSVDRSIGSSSTGLVDFAVLADEYRNRQTSHPSNPDLSK